CQLPTMVEPGSEFQSDLAHDLAPELQRCGCLAPVRVRQIRPNGGVVHGTPPDGRSPFTPAMAVSASDERLAIARRCRQCRLWVIESCRRMPILTEEVRLQGPRREIGDGLHQSASKSAARGSERVVLHARAAGAADRPQSPGATSADPALCGRDARRACGPDAAGSPGATGAG